MLINERLKVGLILIPRTASGTLMRTLVRPGTDWFMNGRHSEACFIRPEWHGFSWHTFIRHPMDRLMSLYRFLRKGEFGLYNNGPDATRWKNGVVNEARMTSFSDWITGSMMSFTHGGSSLSHYQIPEPRKTQWLYVHNPAVKINIHRFEDINQIWDDFSNSVLGLRDFPYDRLMKKNQTDCVKFHVSDRARYAISLRCAWELLAYYPNDEI